MIGVVLAGGASLRFGGRPKGLIAFQGEAMALKVARALSAVAGRVLLEAAQGQGYETLGLELVQADAAHAGKGPLAGIAAGLRAASGGMAAFAPCDMPMLDGEVFEILAREAGQGSGAFAATRNGPEPLVAVLNSAMLPALLETLSGTALPRTHAALERAGARRAQFANVERFANVNTPEELEMLAARRCQKP